MGKISLLPALDHKNLKQDVLMEMIKHVLKVVYILVALLFVMLIFRASHQAISILTQNTYMVAEMLQKMSAQRSLHNWRSSRQGIRHVILIRSMLSWRIYFK